MSTPVPRAAGAASSMLLLALCACSSMHGAKQSTVSPRSPPAEVSEPPQPAQAEPDQAADPGNSAAPVESPARAALCSCTETKSKPKPKPRPKPVHKEAPPQIPTAPAVASTPPGGLVDAQVRSMSVSVMSILGKRVVGPKGEDLGRVVDVLADASGRVRIAIIDFGGFLGVGNHRIAVDWPLLRFSPDAGDSSLLLSLSREKLQTAPEYKDNPRPQTLMEPPPPAPAAPPAPSGPSAAPTSAPPSAPAATATPPTTLATPPADQGKK